MLRPSPVELYPEAFSSEVDTGSREENASKQKIEPRSDSIGAEKALPGLVRLDVELEMNPGIESPVGILRLVLQVDLGKGERHVLRRSPVAAVTERDSRYDDVVHLDD